MVSSKFQPVPAVRNVKHVEGSEPRQFAVSFNEVEARGCNGLEKPVNMTSYWILVGDLYRDPWNSLFIDTLEPGKL